MTCPDWRTPSCIAIIHPCRYSAIVWAICSLAGGHWAHCCPCLSSRACACCLSSAPARRSWNRSWACADRRAASSAGADLARYNFQGPATWDIFDLGDGIVSSRLKRNALELSAGADLGYVTAGNNVVHADVLINATVRQTRGLLGNGFGLLCRADKVGNGYWFLLSSRGEYSIQVASDARENPFPLVPWRYHSVIRQGLQANELRVVCAENYLALFVNDVFLAEAFDDEFRRGELAVVLGAVGREAGVSFDNVRLREARVTGGR